MWKMAMEAIMTNDLRLRRGLTDTTPCPMCGREDETLMHLFRDCDDVKDAWWVISKGIVPNYFFLEEGRRWLELNLEEEVQIEGLGWNVWFGLTTLAIWKRRNEKVFQGVVVSNTELYHRVCTQAMWAQSSIDSASSINVLSTHHTSRQIN